MSDIFFSEDEKEEIYSPPQKSNLLPFLRIIKRKAWLIGFITAIVATPYIYSDWRKNSTSEYVGSFQLLVEPLNFEGKSSDPNSITNPRGVPNDRLLAVDYPTLIRILTSRDMLSKISEKVQSEYSNFDTNRLAQNLTVQRIGNSRFDASKILAVTYKEQNPKVAQLVLEETAQAYLEYSLNSRIQEITTGLEFIEEQLPQLNQNVSRNLNEIQKLQEQYQMIQVDTKGESLLQTIRDIKLQQIQTEREIQEQTRIKNNLQSKLNISVGEAIAISALRENSNYQNLIKQYKDKERELAVASATFNRNSPQVIHLQEEKQELSDLLNAETRRITIQEGLSVNPRRFLVASGNDSILFDLVQQLIEAANNLEALQARQQALSRDINLFEQQAQKFPQVSRRYKELQEELDRANRTREQLLIQKDKLQIQASQTQAPWTVIAQPQVVTDSLGNPVALPTDSNNRVLKGLLGGLLVGLGIAVLMEKIRDKFFTAEDISDVTKPSLILGEIPYNRNLLTTKQTASLIKSWFDLPTHYLPNMGEVDDEHFDFLNAFYKLQANIYLRYREKTIHSIAVCSPKKGDGRSTIALYLARQIAGTGKRVLLVDTNSFKYQLTDKLISTTQVEENLFILVASQQFLENPMQREKLMKEFTASYDHVIYDTPPLLESVIGGFLSVETDGILLVAAINKTDKSLFMKAFEQIETLKLPLLGIVVNHAGAEQLPIDQFTNTDWTQIVNSGSNSKILNPEKGYQQEDKNNSRGTKSKSIKPLNNNQR